MLQIKALVVAQYLEEVVAGVKEQDAGEEDGEKDQDGEKDK